MTQPTTRPKHTSETTRQFLQEFENGFDPVRVATSKVPVTLLGYGEISTVIAFNVPGYRDRAFKRLPLFTSEKEAENYCRLYLEYNKKLISAGIETPPGDAFCVKGHNGIYVAYLSQERLEGQSIANKLLHTRTDAEIEILFRLVVRKLAHLWKLNTQNPELLLGLDAQISNWAIRDFDAAAPISEESRLYFIDTSTPLIRENGVEQMNAHLFLQSAPKPMRWILSRFFLDDIMNRYYNFRLVCTDLLANLYKEQRHDLIPGLTDLVNKTGAEFLEHQPITEKEIEKYYREDKFIWKLFLALRRTDRYMNTRWLGKRYEFTLPGKIKR
ncbi:DUF6206 family protein [Robertkochia flava]|uniref:DUF6206 family protein n=1 Tax=Robertkochia flava TaxID=3447986 RepID=UPI001CCD8A93|nr:DUF6206 family protein [Robertkochia marina]